MHRHTHSLKCASVKYAQITPINMQETGHKQTRLRDLCQEKKTMVNYDTEKIIDSIYKCQSVLIFRSHYHFCDWSSVFTCIETKLEHLDLFFCFFQILATFSIKLQSSSQQLRDQRKCIALILLRRVLRVSKLF